jgi:hypothetical protein
MLSKEIGEGRQYCEGLIGNLTTGVGKTAEGVEAESVEHLGPSRWRRATSDEVLMGAGRRYAEDLAQLERTQQLPDLDHHLPHGIALVGCVERHALGRGDNAPLPFYKLVAFSTDQNLLGRGDDAQALDHSSS